MDVLLGSAQILACLIYSDLQCTNQQRLFRAHIIPNNSIKVFSRNASSRQKNPANWGMLLDVFLPIFFVQHSYFSFIRKNRLEKKLVRLMDYPFSNKFKYDDHSDMTRFFFCLQHQKTGNRTQGSTAAKVIERPWYN